MAMHASRRLLQASGRFAAASPPEAMEVDSEVVVVLFSLLGALICVVGLALVARCAWLRRRSWGLLLPTTTSMDKGLRQDVLRSLPKVSFQPGGPADEGSLSFAECPICLAEFAEGDEVRVLPQCGHRFHVACVDLWLRSRSSCPSCRRVLVAGAEGALECQYSGARSAGAGSPVAAPAEAVQAASPPAQEEVEGVRGEPCEH